MFIERLQTDYNVMRADKEVSQSCIADGEMARSRVVETLLIACGGRSVETEWKGKWVLEVEEMKTENPLDLAKPTRWSCETAWERVSGLNPMDLRNEGG
jgi:hypothetical protein